MTSEIPSSSQLIYDLIESFGPLWAPEPPLYSCYCDVVAVKEIEDKLVVTITHTIIQCEGIEDLISDQPLPESDWPFECIYVRDEATQEWKFESSELKAHESNVEIAPDPRMDAVFEMIFRQLDWHDYLDAYEMTTAELMAKLPEKYRKFYEPHHKQFLADGEFV